jgi:hypothetical protein
MAKSQKHSCFHDHDDACKTILCENNAGSAMMSSLSDTDIPCERFHKQFMRTKGLKDQEQHKREKEREG